MKEAECPYCGQIFKAETQELAEEKEGVHRSTHFNASDKDFTTRRTQKISINSQRRRPLK